MPLRQENCRTFHRALYAGWNQQVTLYKRDDVNRSVVTPYVLYDVLPDDIVRTGEPIETQTTSSHRRTFQIPRIELERVGVWVINALDAIQDDQGRFWQPESTTVIFNKLGENYIDVDCLITDPLVGASVQG